ncbi:hypothetical protein QR680_008993 [Steinernema hermaphroditum]|uniref:PPM-type phosphatase domain-containing protein n=1 Tax=Steinernema hermaphroditum TaxID=289476 RepID=A0AA39M937_9BILA|nr:hypothetical protein QR680_008993 [Steinernema hermaphroditum]
MWKRTPPPSLLVRRGMRSRSSTDAQLRAHERSCILFEDAVARVDVCQLAANRPIEDYFSASKCLSSNAFLFGVFDGHGGASCSRHVSTRLFDYHCASVLSKHTVAEMPLRERLQWLFSSADFRLPAPFKQTHERNVRDFHNKFVGDSDLCTVRKAMQAAFIALDEDIAAGALPDAKGRVCRMSASVATSGSCATVAHVRHNHLHVANVGDGAAVLGVNHHGMIIARQLSKAHTIENADEVKRIRNSHPASEHTTVLRGGRLLGELYPLRAFGDVRYKWPAQLQRVVMEPLGDTLPQFLLSPPYLTALPEVFYHQLTPNDRFMVIASDGLWDWLDPDTVVRLVNDHNLGTQTLTPYVPKIGSNLKQVSKELKERRAGESKKPLDDNSATHIIRHALGGVTGGTELQYERLRDSLQLPPGMARSHRDDITVIVIHFNDEYLSNPPERSDAGI